MSNNFLKRTASAAVFAGVMAVALLVNVYFFAAVFGFIALVVLYEYQSVTMLKFSRTALISAGLLLYATVFLHLIFKFPPKLFLLSIPVILGVLIVELFAKKLLEDAVPKSIYALIYTVLPFAALLSMAYPNQTFTCVYPLAVFIFLWANDSGAYIIGSLIGKHKMFERISPKKTWEGTIGGILVSILASIIYAQFYTKLALSEWLILAGMTAILGTFGDLYESMLKRRAGVKDSGKIMPGHGGLLDRFDSLLFAAPAAWVYLEVMEKI